MTGIYCSVEILTLESLEVEGCRLKFFPRDRPFVCSSRLGSNRSQHPGMVIAWLPNDNKMEGNSAEFIKWLRYKQLKYDNN